MLPPAAECRHHLRRPVQPAADRWRCRAEFRFWVNRRRVGVFVPFATSAGAGGEHHRRRRHHRLRELGFRARPTGYGGMRGDVARGGGQGRRHWHVTRCVRVDWGGSGGYIRVIVKNQTFGRIIRDGIVAIVIVASAASAASLSGRHLDMRTEVETSRRLYGADWLSLMSHGRNAGATTAENRTSAAPKRSPAAAAETKNSDAGKRNSVAEKNNRLVDDGGNLVTSKGKTRHAHR